MGVDYEIFLQVLVGNCWITIVAFVARGDDVMTAYELLTDKNKDIKGDYGTNYDVVPFNPIFRTNSKQSKLN